MKIAVSLLKIVHKNLDINIEHNTVDDITQQNDTKIEIPYAISNPIGFVHKLLKCKEKLKMVQINTVVLVFMAIAAGAQILVHKNLGC